jgi:tight adherence protein B
MSTGLTIFILLVFATVFFLMQGLVVPVFGEGAKARKQLLKKLTDIEQGSGQESYTSLLREKYLRKLSPWERTLESMPAMEALAERIEQAGHKYLAYRVLFVAIVLALAAAVVAWTYTRLMYTPPIAALMFGYLPFMKISRDRASRLALFEEQLPDAIDTMTRALKAGHPFSQTLKLISEDMDDPLAGEFELTFGDINYGNDVRRAMLGLLKRVPSVTLMALVTSVLVQKETGGNLAEILDRISGVLRGRFRFHRKVKTLSAEGRMSAWVLAVIPLGLFAALHITSPDYLPMLVEDPRGQKMIIAGSILSSIGILWIRKLLRIEV